MPKDYKTILELERDEQHKKDPPKDLFLPSAVAKENATKNDREYVKPLWCKLGFHKMVRIVRSERI